VPTLTLYGKPGCHLCDDARAAVERVTARREVPVELVAVSRDPVLFARYGERIPVLELDGETLFEFFVDEAVLERRLDRVIA
jgi:glutathione S-transferase